MSSTRKKTHLAVVQMKVLLLGATGEEPSFQAWRVALAREGTPFVAIALGTERMPSVLVDELGRSSFQAVILATGELLEQSLGSSHRHALEQLEHEFGLRRLIAHAYPCAAVGLQRPAWAGPLDGISATLTPAGRRVFAYLRLTVPIDSGSWGYLARPASEERFETLVAAPDGSALVGIHRRQDGGEEMVQTVAANPGQTHSQLLRHGQLAWVTRGAYLGYERNYLSLHVDDVLLPNRVPDVAASMSDSGSGGLIRMSAQDALHTARWSQANQLRLELVCNGAGSERHAREIGVEQDPLLAALLRERDTFGWVNHTYEHILLDDASRATIEAEVARNVSWAREVGIELEPRALVTGGHTGLANLAATPPRGENPELAPALRAQGVRFIACDASRPYPVHPQDPVGPRLPAGTPFAVGDAIAVPRYPTALAWYAASEQQALDALRSAHAADPPGSWETLVIRESRRILTLLLGNDPRPHYFHQSNLAGADRPGIMCALIDAVLGLYRRLIATDVPIVQPKLAEVGELLVRWAAWREALASGSIDAYADHEQLTIVNRASTVLDVPLTGTRVGSEYGGTRSGWVRASPGETVVRVG